MCLSFKTNLYQTIQKEVTQQLVTYLPEILTLSLQATVMILLTTQQMLVPLIIPAQLTTSFQAMITTQQMLGNQLTKLQPRDISFFNLVAAEPSMYLESKDHMYTDITGFTNTVCVRATTVIINAVTLQQLMPHCLLGDTKTQYNKELMNIEHISYKYLQNNVNKLCKVLEAWFHKALTKALYALKMICYSVNDITQ